MLTVRRQCSDEVDRDPWNDFVRAAPQGSYRQSTFYADFQESCRAERAHYFAAELDGLRVGQLLAIEGASYGWGLARRPLARLSLPLVRQLLPRLYWCEGPVLTAGMDQLPAHRALVASAAAYGRKRGCVCINGHPSYLGICATRDRDAVRQVYLDLGFTGCELQTPLLRTNRSEEDLWRGVRRDGKTKVKKARRQGVEIVGVGYDPDLRRQAHEVARETAARNATAVDSYDDFCRSLDHLYRHDVGEAFLSMHDGRAASFQRTVHFGDHATLGGVSYSDYSRDEKIYGNDLMQWHMIVWARERGIISLDYGGAEPDADDPKKKGIFDFKMKWGGDLVPYDYFELVPEKRLAGSLFATVRSALSGR